MNKLVYQQIYDEILFKINASELRPGDKLPSERKLIKDFKTSDTSVRRALDMLAEEGYIIKRHGSGNYVGDNVKSEGLGKNPDLVFVLPSIFGVDAGLPSLQAKLSAALPKLKIQLISTSAGFIDSEQARRLLAFHKCPLVILNDRNHTAEMARNGLLAPLENSTSIANHLSSMPENLLWRFPGADGAPHYFGAPYHYSTTCFTLNLDLAEMAGLDSARPPRLWSELLDWGRAFNKWRNREGRFELHPFFCFHRNAFNALGSIYFMALNGKPWLLPGEELKRGLKEFFNFFDAIHQDDMTESVSVQAPDPFVSGKYLFHLQGGPWLPRDLSRFNRTMRWKTIETPVPAMQRPRIAHVGTRLISLVMPETFKLSAAERLVDALFAPEFTFDFAWRSGALPAEPQTAREFAKDRKGLTPFCEAIFSSLEPHEPADELRWLNLNEIMERRLNGEIKSVDEMVGLHCDFISKLR